MSQQQKYTSDISLNASKVNLAKVTKSGARGEAKYQNVCRLPNTKKLITIRRADGRDLHLCRKHARAWLGEL